MEWLCHTTSCPQHTPSATVQLLVQICSGLGMETQWGVCQISQSTWWEDFDGIWWCAIWEDK